MSQTSMFVCDEYHARSYPGLGFPCTFHQDCECAHSTCKLHWLTVNGLPDVAARLANNYKAQDWLGNWGHLLYDPKKHGRNPKRRSTAAKIVRAMRKGADYADAVRAGAWIGAAL